MKKQQLDRIQFVNKNKMVIDEKHEVAIERDGSKRKFVYENQVFENEDSLFTHIDEITSTGSVGGGYEGPGLAPANKLVRRTYAPYTQIVENVEKLVKEALIEEFVKLHPTYNLTQLYREANAKNSQEYIQGVENGIKIVYATVLPAQEPNYYRDNNDYNGDGIPNQHKENETNLDLQYDGNVSDAFKQRVTDELAKDPTGVKLMQAAIRKAEVKDANPANHNLIQLGSDIEFAQKPTEEKPKEEPKTEEPKEQNNKTPRKGVAALGFSLKQESAMSHLKFKFKNKKFDDLSILNESVPDKAKVDDTIFEMEDCVGNNFLIEWKDGQGTILEHRNLLSEQKSLNKAQHLFEKFESREGNRSSKNITFDYFTKPTKTKMLREEFEGDLESICEKLNSNNVGGHAALELLNSYNSELMGQGVKSIEDHQHRNFWGDIRLKYIDMGNSSMKTLIYDVDREMFVCAAIDTYIEEQKIVKK
jgi:hypothetical protein